MAYGLIGLGNDLERQAQQGLGELAGQQAQQKAANEQMEAAERQQTMSTVGTGAGVGMMAGGPVGAAIGAGAGFLIDSIF